MGKPPRIFAHRITDDAGHVDAEAPQVLEYNDLAENINGQCYYFHPVPQYVFKQADTGLNRP